MLDHKTGREEWRAGSARVVGRADNRHEGRERSTAPSSTPTPHTRLWTTQQRFSCFESRPLGDGRDLRTTSSERHTEKAEPHLRLPPGGVERGVHRAARALISRSYGPVQIFRLGGNDRCLRTR